MKKNQFNELIGNFINKSCIYQEGRVICCAQVNDVQLFDTEMQASLIVTPVPGFLSYSLTNWTISCIWKYFTFEEERWSAVCTGLIWKVYFDLDFITKISELAITLPSDQSEQQRRFILGKNVNKLDQELLRARRESR